MECCGIEPGPLWWEASPLSLTFLRENISVYLILILFIMGPGGAEIVIMNFQRLTLTKGKRHSSSNGRKHRKKKRRQWYVQTFITLVYFGLNGAVYRAWRLIAWLSLITASPSAYLMSLTTGKHMNHTHTLMYVLALTDTPSSSLASVITLATNSIIQSFLTQLAVV
jgi:hypothetical protein